MITLAQRIIMAMSSRQRKAMQARVRPWSRSTYSGSAVPSTSMMDTLCCCPWTPPRTVLSFWRHSCGDRETEGPGHVKGHLTERRLWTIFTNLALQWRSMITLMLIAAFVSLLPSGGYLRPLGQIWGVLLNTAPTVTSGTARFPEFGYTANVHVQLLLFVQ